MSNYPLNPNLKDFWQWKLAKNKLVYKYARHRVLYGGRASSKTHEFAGAAAKISSETPTRFLCVRRFQNKIKESVYTVIKNKISEFELGGFDVLSTTIGHSNGSEFVFYGIERNTDEIKSFEGADVLWIEEAHNLTKEQWEILEPTIRKEGSEIWVSFNPRLVTDFVWQHFIVNPPQDSIVRLINYDNNPYLSQTPLSSIENLKKRDYEAFQHVYMGEPLSDDDATIIKRSWVEAAIDFHKKVKLSMGGAKVIGYDVADSGEDKNAICLSDGSIVRHVEEWQAGENQLKKSADKVRLCATENRASIIYDSIGVGAHTGSTLQAAGFNQFAGFNAGGKVRRPNIKYNGVKQKEYFSNVKAQAWWMLADRFRNTYDYLHNGNKDYRPDELISICSDACNIESLKTELCTPFRDFDGAGRVKVESKADLKKRDIMSPNKADAVIMSQSHNLINFARSGELETAGF
jgi:phage terminase large subunit